MKIKRIYSILAYLLAACIISTSVLPRYARAEEKQNYSGIQSDFIEDTSIKKDDTKDFVNLATDYYNKMSKAFDNNDYKQAKQNAKLLLSLVEDYKSVTLKQFEDIKNSLGENMSKEISDRQIEYENIFKSQMDDLQEILSNIINASEINKKTISEYLSKLAKGLISEEEHNPIGNNLPYNVSANEPEEKVLGSNGGSVISQNNTYTRQEMLSEPDKADLQITDETMLNEEVMELAEQLKTPLAVYEYLKNTVNYESYYGSRKGAIATFEQNGGNDKDQASLLIGMLRHLGYPAKYVTGNIRIDKDQAMKLTGAEDIRAAARILAAQGRPVTCITINGEIQYIDMDQTWVKAYVPYEDYRGAGNNKGKSYWIPLDVSFKLYEKQVGVFDLLEEKGITEEAFINANNEKNYTGTKEFIKEWEKKLGALENEEVRLISKAIIKEDNGYLPLSLPYTSIYKDSTYTKISDAQSDSITFELPGLKKMVKSSLLCGKKITLEYIPATKADEEIFSEYNNLFEIPAYLLKVKPVIKADNIIIGEGNSLTLGSSQNFTMVIKTGMKENVVNNLLRAGSFYQITVDTQSISSRELEKAASAAYDNINSINIDNVYSDEYLGAILEFAGKAYFAQVDINNRLLSEQMNVCDMRLLSVGMTGYEVGVSTLFGMPRAIHEGSLFIDVDSEAHSVVSYNNDLDNEKKFVMSSGMMGSSFEHTIWEEITGKSALSTIRVLEEAQAQNVEILMLSSANIDKEIHRLNVSDGVLSDVKNAVTGGKIVTIPKDKMTIGSWKGSGYIVMDPNTGAAGYMISGGIAGGVTDEEVSLAYMVNIGLSIWDMAEAIIMMSSALAAIAAGGLLVGGIFLVLSVACLVFAINTYYQTISLMIAYMAGDEEAGRQLIEDAWINAAVSIGITALSAIAKPIVKGVLKNKLVREFGEEFVENVIKNGDDIPDIGRIINQLRKLDYTDDIIKEVIEKAGKNGGDWLKKMAGKGFSDDLLRKIIDAPNFESFSDDLLNAIKNSKGHADDIISAVTKYGDEAADVIVKYGDEAAECITKYGDDAVKALKNDITPDIMKQLDDLGIKPKDYLDNGIINKETAEKVINNTNKPLEILKETDMFTDYINKSGTKIRVPKQSKESILDSISKNLDSADIGKRTEAKVGDFINNNTNATITDFGNKIKNKNNQVIGDIDVATEKNFIEVKTSISEVKKEQLYKYIDYSNANYMNTGNKKVILYIDNVIDLTNVNNLKLIETIKDMGITVINKLEDLKGVIK